VACVQKFSGPQGMKPVSSRHLAPFMGTMSARPARAPAGDATTVATAKSCRGTTRVRSEAERPCQPCQVRGEAGIDWPDGRSSDGSRERFRISARVHTARKDRGSGSVTPEPAIGADLPGEPGQLRRSVQRFDTPACTG
jgi:hypothetical protein